MNVGIFCYRRHCGWHSRRGCHSGSVWSGICDMPDHCMPQLVWENSLAAFIMKGGVQVAIRGTAVTGAVMLHGPVSSGTTVPVTGERVAGSITGRSCGCSLPVRAL